MGLKLVNASSTQGDCRAACCGDPACEVWQWATKRTDRNQASSLYKSCYTGKGFECRSVRTDDFLVYAGQRVSHGTKLGQGVWCTGNGMHKVDYPSTLSHVERTDKCRSACFFDKDCQAWQYSTLKGCWSGSSTSCSKDVSLAFTIMEAQQFDRSCEAAGELKTDYLQVFVVIVAAALLLICFASTVIFFNICGAKRAQTPRSPRSPRRPKSPGSRRQHSDDEDAASDDLTHDPQNLSRPASTGGVYWPLQVNSQSPSGAASPVMMSQSPSGTVSPNMSVMGPRPIENSFGAVSGASSGSSFGQGTSPLLGQQYRQQQMPFVMQPGARPAGGAPTGYYPQQ